MNFFEPYVTGIDKMLQEGFVVFKIIWKFSSRKYTEFLDIENLPKEFQDAIYDELSTDNILKKIIQEELDIDMDFEENEEAIEKAVTEFRAGETSFEMTLQEKFQAKYRGVRVSFGYPACPRLEDQTKLFTLLDIERTIGVALPEGYTMDPEASVSALVFHHPDGRYFAISEQDLEAFLDRLPESA